MPRRTALLVTAQAAKPKHENLGRGPRLWNAHRRIERTTGLLREQLKVYRQGFPLDLEWRSQASPDVVKFVDDMRRLEMDTDTFRAKDNTGTIREENTLKPGERRLLPERQEQLLFNPLGYFAKSEHVPRALRENKIYFPDFTVTLLRTPLYPPRFASFWVPLWFNKLDMKNFLHEVYNVEILHVRTTVVAGRIEREVNPKAWLAAGGQGSKTRTERKKKMTIELVEPFVWPKPVKDDPKDPAWDKESYWTKAKSQMDETKDRGPLSKMERDEVHRLSIAEQARAILQGNAKWRPTWQEIPSHVQQLTGQKVRHAE